MLRTTFFDKGHALFSRMFDASWLRRGQGILDSGCWQCLSEPLFAPRGQLCSENTRTGSSTWTCTTLKRNYENKGEHLVGKLVVTSQEMPGYAGEPLQKAQLRRPSVSSTTKCNIHKTSGAPGVEKVRDERHAQVRKNDGSYM